MGWSGHAQAIFGDRPVFSCVRKRSYSSSQLVSPSPSVIPRDSWHPLPYIASLNRHVIEARGGKTENPGKIRHPPKSNKTMVWQEVYRKQIFRSRWLGPQVGQSTRRQKKAFQISSPVDRSLPNQRKDRLPHLQATDYWREDWGPPGKRAQP